MKRLLVVDDEASNRDLVARAFRDLFEVHMANDGQHGLEVARELRPDIVISDQRMPSMTGVEMLTLIKKELPNTIRLLVTGYTDYQTLVQAVNGAKVHHYVEKPFQTLDLKTAVEAIVRTAELERERSSLVEKLQQNEARLQEMVEERTRALEEANAQLRELAVRDGLTSLFNHRYLLEYLSMELARAKRYQRPFSLIFIDLDDFKAINDQHGHAVGDDVLRKVAMVLSQQYGLRDSDFAARYGGEEFCVVLPETPLDGGIIKANRICEEIRNIDWSTINPGLDKGVTASLGVASYPEAGDNPGALLLRADEAQYRAKQAGKNRVAA